MSLPTTSLTIFCMFFAGELLNFSVASGSSGICLLPGCFENVNHAREQVCSLVFHQDLNVQDS